MRIREIFLPLMVLLVLTACAAGSGRQGTEITVSGTGPTAQVQSGTNAIFVMTVKNTGPYDASNIKVVDNVGNQLKLISITCAATGGATCPNPATVEMTIPTIPNGGALVFSVTVQLDTGATGTIQNTMSASFADEIDPTQETASVTATAFSIVTNVVVSGKGPTTTLIGGSPAVFVMTVTNNGPDATGAFNVYDNVGNGLSLTSITCAATGGATCPTTVGVLTAIETLPSGGVLTFTVNTVVGENVNGTVTNETVVDVSTNPTSTTNSFFATATVVTADLAVSGTAPAGPLVGGQATSFIMVVTNNGPGTAQNLVLTNSLSAGLTATGTLTCVASNGAVCPAVLGPSMTLASMPDTGILTFTVPCTVNLTSSGQVTDTLTVSSTTDPRGNQVATVGVGSGSSYLIVTETGTNQVNAGGTATFTAVVSNTGPAVATNVIVTYALSGPAGSVATVTCAAAASVACPTTLGPMMTVPTIPVGRSLTFTFTVPVPTTADGQGAIVNTVTASAVGNGDVTLNTATFSTLPINASNGTYQVFAANGQQYTLVINFDSLTYSITGNIATINRTFTANGTLGGYTVNGTTQFNVATNLIIGGENFGTGNIPYVAARVFGTTTRQLASTPGPNYNLMTLTVPTNGNAPSTTVGTARVSGNTLSVCQSTSNAGVAVPQNCSGTNFPTGSLQNYDLQVNGNVYSGVNTVSGLPMPFTFQLAVIDATYAFLSTATDANGNPQFLIGLPDGPALAGGSSEGPSTTGDYITLTLTNSTYAFTGLIGQSDNAALARISPNAGPFSMLVGNRASDGAQIYVMQSFPLSVAFGGPGGAASGLVQVTIP